MAVFSQVEFDLLVNDEVALLGIVRLRIRT